MLNAYIRTYGPRLYGLCRSLCARGAGGHAGSATLDADALYQDTWLKVLTCFEQYDPSLPFEPWLTRICVNTYRNVLRRVARAPLFDGFANADEKVVALEAVPAPEAPSYAYLHAAIVRLPERLRVTVILYYFQDMDVGCVAQTLGIPPGTVKSRLSKARQMLREVLADE